MSRLTMLTATSATLAGGGGPVDPPPPLDPNVPDPPDATTGLIRPTMAPALSITVGPTGADYDDLHDAIVAAAAEQNAMGGAWSSRLVNLILAPGTYSVPGEEMRWMAFYSSTGSGDPADVVITASADSLGTFHALGPVYLEGITLETAEGSGVGPRYPFHITQNAFTSVVGAVVAAYCAFTARNDEATGGGSPGHGAAIGLDADPGTETLFYECVLNPDPAGTLPMILHGGFTAGAAIRLSFVQTTVDGAILYNDNGTGNDDEVWIMDTTADGADIDGAATMLHLGGTSVGMSTTGSTATVDTDPDWPLPTWT